MTIIMTVAGVNCDAKVLDNEITCRIPKNMTIPSEGLPVKVSQGLDDDYLTDLPQASMQHGQGHTCQVCEALN